MVRVQAARPTARGANVHRRLENTIFEAFDTHMLSTIVESTNFSTAQKRSQCLVMLESSVTIRVDSKQSKQWPKSRYVLSIAVTDHEYL